MRRIETVIALAVFGLAGFCLLRLLAGIAMGAVK